MGTSGSSILDVNKGQADLPVKAVIYSFDFSLIIHMNQFTFNILQTTTD